ncbi:PspA/IM30 family protein [Oceanobacillus chungangensis]|uniref:Phage shock protein A n=1 Tax=Oceanobacillus chungangensis TaxID=1229152 RepID=A0A3D8PK96_9BACI|nr:PspA/IM30 family protein [Oceanobacillus chungangensis]RDW15907.1 phage shock protein A [Oceanobacillus chungangensis]
MGILTRFKDIMSSNINPLIERTDNPEKMINQYLKNLYLDLGTIKAETASVKAEEQRTLRALNECKVDQNKMQRYAVKALENGNEDQARNFLERKAALDTKESELQAAYDSATANSIKMKQLREKLSADIQSLEMRFSVIKGNSIAAKSQQRVNSPIFDQMEEKTKFALDEATALAELRRDPFEELEEPERTKENKRDIDEELNNLKKQLGDGK